MMRLTTKNRIPRQCPHRPHWASRPCTIPGRLLVGKWIGRRDANSNTEGDAFPPISHHPLESSNYYHENWIAYPSIDNPKLPANLILSKSKGWSTKVETTPPLTPATKCSYLTVRKVETMVRKNEDEGGLAPPPLAPLVAMTDPRRPDKDLTGQRGRNSRVWHHDGR